MSDHQTEVAKWYTRARRFPQLIGRTPDGTQIPGGPYTFTQVIGGAVFLYAAFKTVDLWGRFGLIGNFALMAATGWVVIKLLGQIPPGARSPLTVLGGALNAWLAPAAGRVAGKPVSAKRPHTVRTVLIIHHHQPACTATRSTRRRIRDVAADPVRPATSPVPSDRPPLPADHPSQLTGLQQLLASSGRCGDINRRSHPSHLHPPVHVQSVPAQSIPAQSVPAQSVPAQPFDRTTEDI